MSTNYYNARELPRHHLRAAVAAVLHRLPVEHVPILRARYGIDSPALSVAKTIKSLGVSRTDIRQADARAMAMLLHPAQQSLIRSIAEVDSTRSDPRVEVQDAIEAIRKLTPELINHLKAQVDDLIKVRWDVFEHLVAELFASAGFRDVSVIGRNPESAADIFAAWKVSPLGADIRYFIEVKRWKDRIGVEVIDRVYGAMLAERQVHGWHAALIVSVVGFSDFKKYSRGALRNMGIELRDKDDVAKWLIDYQPDENGLWLPKPRRGLPTANAP